MTVDWWTGRWVDSGVVGRAAAHRLLHCVVDFEDDTYSAVVAVVFFLVFAAVGGEVAEDVVHSAACGSWM